MLKTCLTLLQRLLESQHTSPNSHRGLARQPTFIVRLGLTRSPQQPKAAYQLSGEHLTGDE
jgi:hypothetical protein